MSKAEINPGNDDIQQIVSEMQETCDVDGYDVSIGINRQGMIVLSGTRREVQNLLASEGFSDRFLEGKSIKELKSLITD